MAPIQEYVGTLIYVGVALFIGVAALLVGALLGPKKPGRAKLMPYESGNDPAGEVKRFPVHFYVVAMLFILFFQVIRKIKLICCRMTSIHP